MRPRTESGSHAVAGTNLEHARAHNRRVVIEAIRLHGHLTRADIARMTSLTPQTVSNIAAELLDADMLLPGEPVREGGRGQPAIPLAINPDGAYSIGLQIDHRSLIAVVVDLAGKVRGRVEHAVSRPTPEHALPLITDTLQSLQRELGIDWRRVLGIGLVMPGPFGVEGMSSIGATTLPGWEDPAIIEQLRQRTGLPVLLENDATAAAIGERLHGTARHLRNFVYLFIGTGLGGGLFLDGRLYKGARGNAGEIGHMIVVPEGRPCDCGNRGCLERYVSLHAAYEALQVDDPTHCTPARLQHALATGDAALDRWIGSAVPPLRQAINILESLLDIDSIVIGGFMPSDVIAQLLSRLDPLPASIRHRSDAATRVRIGTAGPDTAALGAAALPLFDEFNPHYEALLKKS